MKPYWNFNDSRRTNLSLDEFLDGQDPTNFFSGKEPWPEGVKKLSWQTFFRVCTEEMDDLSQRAMSSRPSEPQGIRSSSVRVGVDRPLDEVIGEERFVDELHGELTAARYKASPVRRVYRCTYQKPTENCDRWAYL
jgi:hypothetical protein